jgi:hypothetical protein
VRQSKELPRFFAKDARPGRVPQPQRYGRSEISDTDRGSRVTSAKIAGMTTTGVRISMAGKGRFVNSIVCVIIT